MKKLLNYLLVGSILVIGAACDEDYSEDFDGGKFEYVGINSNAAPSSIFEGNGAAANTVTIPVRYGNEVVPGQAITVNMSVSGEAVIGTDYTLAGVDGLSGNNFSVTIPADTSVVNFTLTTMTNVETGPDRAVTFTVVSTSNNASIGFPYFASYEVTIQDDDCAYDLVAEYTGESAVSEVYAPDDIYGPYDPGVTFSGTANVLNVANFWDSGMACTITLNPVDNSVVLSSGGDFAQYGYTWNITGEGFLSPCTGQILLTAKITSPDYNGGYDSEFGYDIQFPTTD